MYIIKSEIYLYLIFVKYYYIYHSLIYKKGNTKYSYYMSKTYNEGLGGKT